MPESAEQDYTMLSDLQLASLYAKRNPKAVRTVMTRNNQRLFRTAYSILKSRSEAEDVVQNVYLKAFSSMSSFVGKSTLSTWLTRITVNEALEHKRKAQRRKEYFELNSVIALQQQKDANMSSNASYNEPDRAAARAQLRKLIENAIDQLPEVFKLTFVLREVEQLSVAEISEILNIPTATVKTRSLRAKRLLQKELLAEIGGALSDSFPFAGADCEAMTRKVLMQLREQEKVSGINH